MAFDGSQALLTAFTANDAGPVVYWHGGEGQFDAWSNETDDSWGGATVTFQYRANSAAPWVAVGDDSTMTADDGCIFEMAAGEIRAKVTGGSGKSLGAQVRKAN